MKKIHMKVIFFLTLTVLLMSAGVTTALASSGGKMININTATQEELEAIPLITPELATAIVEYREENGNFAVIEELMQVDGFDSGLLQKIRAFLFLEGIGAEDCSC